MSRRGSRKRVVKPSMSYLPVPLWRRAFAYVIDLIIVSFVIFLPMGYYFSDVTEGDFDDVLSYADDDREFSFVNFLLSFSIAFLSVMYWGLLEYKLGQSVGKMAMGLKVVDVKGKRLTFGQCFLRSVTKMSTFVLLLDLMYGIFKRDYRRYFEVMSNTKVVSVNGTF